MKAKPTPTWQPFTVYHAGFTVWIDTPRMLAVWMNNQNDQVIQS